MRENTRRHFLKQAGFTALGTGPWAASEAAHPEFAPQEAWTLHGEQFRINKAYEGGWVQNFTSTVEALPKDRWRIWTSVSMPETGIKNIGYHEGKVGGEWKPVWAVCTTGKPDPTAELAIGGMPEGAHPVQVVTIRLQNGLTRLYFWAHGEGIVRYLAADSIDETARQFEVVNRLEPCLYHPGDRAVGGAAAKEAGLSRFGKKVAKPIEGEPLAPAALISNDATNVYQLADGSFEMFSVTLLEVNKDNPRYAPQDNLKGFLRVIDRYTSADGLKWGNRKRVITPDSNDPIDQQFYFLSVTHTEKGRLGMLGSYRLDAQAIDIEPCFSTDGITWERPQRKPWIPRDKEDEGIATYLLHAPHNLVQRDGRWWLFYTGGNFSHNHKHSHGTPDRAILVASCQDVWGG
ncbi:MAG: hypothetical protein P1U86_11830 [Verrucomicrobiales bacterium]|nr:hypothetical protein [Verrucomicrobiales bacterium]